MNNNRLQVDGTSLSGWLSRISLAQDVHSESATLSYSQTASAFQSKEDEGVTLVITLKKDLRTGETPALWFSSEVAANLGIPFLNFTHIKRKYF